MLKLMPWEKIWPLLFLQIKQFRYQCAIIWRKKKKSKSMHYNHFSRSTKKTMTLSFSHYLWALMNHCDHFWSWLEESWCWSVQLKPKRCQGPTCKSGTSTWVPQNKLCFSNYSSLQQPPAWSSKNSPWPALHCQQNPTQALTGSEGIPRYPWE